MGYLEVHCCFRHLALSQSSHQKFMGQLVGQKYGYTKVLVNKRQKYKSTNKVSKWILKLIRGKCYSNL